MTALRDDRPLAICILGPTASGKTAAASMLHEHWHGDVISVDSAMIYREMDIGTAKPTRDELQRVPHRLVNICDPAESYSAAQFRRDALAAMQEIHDAGRVPLLVGGTMLYFKTLLDGTTDLPATSSELREMLHARMEKEGLAVLHAELTQVDPEAGARIHPNDPQRTLRALEVFHQTGISLSEHWRRQRANPLPWRIESLALAPAERSTLHARIAARFDGMLNDGFIEEVAALKARGDLSLSLPSMRSVGYRQVWEYLDGGCDYETMREKAIIATRQLAKRQMTWLRSWKQPLTWCDMTSTDASATLLKTVRRAYT